MTQHHAPQGNPAPQAEDGGSRALAVAVLVLGGVWTAMSALAEVPYARVALDYAADRDPRDLTVTLGSLLGLGAIALILPLWIVTCLWLRAERRRLAGRRHFKHGTPGTFASWIVPLANFVWPYRIVREAHEAAVEPLRRVSLGLWWTLWLLALVAGRVSVRLFDSQGYGDPAGAVLATSAIYVVLLVAAYVMWVKVVRSTSSGNGG